MTPTRLSRYLPAFLLLFCLLPPAAKAQDGGIVQKLYENALQLLRGGKTEEALKGFRQIYDSYANTPQAPDALYQAGSFYYPAMDLNDLGAATRDQIQKAFPLLDRIRSQYGTSSRAPEALYKLGLLALEPDNPKTSANEAYAAFTSVANVYPGSPLVADALFGAAMSQMRSGAYEAALEDFSNLLEQVPGFEDAPRAYLAFGYSQYRAGDYPRAMEDYQKVRDLFTGKPEGQVALERLTLLHRLRLLPSTGRAITYSLDPSFQGKLQNLGLRSVSSLAVAPDGTLLVADGKEGLALKVDSRGHPTGTTPFPGAQVVALDPRGSSLVAGDGNILVGRKQQPLVRPDSSSSPRPIRETPGIAVDRDGRIYVVDGKSDEVLLFGRALDFHGPVFKSTAGDLGEMKVGFDNQIYILDTRDKSLSVILDGKPMPGIRLGDPPASISEPVSIAVDELGDLYICDASAGRVVVLDPAGKRVLATLGGDRGKSGILTPEKVEVDRQGRIYIYDRKADAILRFQ
jgi:TolA-binding protein/sugar lactone lactonase YvrE